MMLCGIDEARRGPIIGPMVMCAAVVNESRHDELVKINPKDSKLLTESQREILYEILVKFLDNYKVIIVNPEEIDRAVERKDNLNLNFLEAQKVKIMLDEINPDKAIIDCPSNNIKSYKSYLAEILDNKKIELQLEHKAERHPIVAAASIIAKVLGDLELEKIKKKIGVDFGSGYLSDPKTVKFLDENYDKHPEIFRKSWFPYQQLVNKKFQKRLDDFTRFLKEEPKESPILKKLEKLEDFGYKFETPKSAHELAIMKGACTIILYKSGKVLIQGNEEAKTSVKKLLGV